MVLYIEQEYHMRKICTFIGGSNIKVDSFLKDKISKVLKNIIYDDCRHFYCGCFGNFSLLCATVIREMQKQSYNVSLTCFVPILENANYYVSQLESTDLYDDIHILEDYSLKDLDLFLISKSSIIIFICSETDKNKDLIEYAVKKHKRIIYI